MQDSTNDTNSLVLALAIRPVGKTAEFQFRQIPVERHWTDNPGCQLCTKIRLGRDRESQMRERRLARPICGMFAQALCGFSSQL